MPETPQNGCLNVTVAVPAFSGVLRTPVILETDDPNRPVLFPRGARVFILNDGSMSNFIRDCDRQEVIQLFQETKRPDG